MAVGVVVVVRWKYETTDVAEGGILTTASDLLFHGGREGYFKVLDAQTGTLLWKANLGGQIMNGPITYAVNGSSTWPPSRATRWWRSPFGTDLGAERSTPRSTRCAQQELALWHRLTFREVFVSQPSFLCGNTIRNMRAMVFRVSGMSGGAAVLFGMVISACGTAQNGAQPGGVHPPVTAARYEQWKTELSNWGR